MPSHLEVKIVDAETDHVLGRSIVRNIEDNDVDQLPYRLVDNHVYGRNEVDDLRARLTELNQQDELNDYWPNARDPDVIALVSDESFEPFEVNDDDEPVDEDGQVDFSIPARRWNLAQERVARSRKAAQELANDKVLANVL